MADAHTLPVTYESWLRQAEAGEDQLRRAGKTVFRAVLEPDAFRQFCLGNGLNIDGKARNEFAVRAAMQAYRDGKVRV